MKYKETKRNLLYVILIIVFISVLFPLSAQAQLEQAQSSLDDLGLRFSISPTLPRANAEVSARVESFVVNLNSANISWFVNGSQKASGVGEKTFLFKTGSLGSVTTVRVVASFQGITNEKSIKIVPQHVSLVWESISYTPPFYKGKTLNPPGGDIRLVALPKIQDNSGRVVPSSNLIYTWRLDDKILGNLSGTGRSSVVIEGSVFGTEPRISVTVSTLDELSEARNSVRVTVNDPEVIIYERDPLLGILFNKSVGESWGITKDETTLEAYPYFFSGDRNTPVYTWKLNRRGIPNPVASITLQKPDGSGQSYVSVSAQHHKKILQSSGKDIQAIFGEQ